MTFVICVGIVCASFLAAFRWHLDSRTRAKDVSTEITSSLHTIRAATEDLKERVGRLEMSRIKIG